MPRTSVFRCLLPGRSWCVSLPTKVKDVSRSGKKKKSRRKKKKQQQQQKNNSSSSRTVCTAASTLHSSSSSLESWKYRSGENVAEPEIYVRNPKTGGFDYVPAQHYHQKRSGRNQRKKKKRGLKPSAVDPIINSEDSSSDLSISSLQCSSSSLDSWGDSSSNAKVRDARSKKREKEGLYQNFKQAMPKKNVPSTADAAVITTTTSSSSFSSLPTVHVQPPRSSSSSSTTSSPSSPLSQYSRRNHSHCHHRRLNLSRKANHKFVSPTELLQWEGEKQTLTDHKASVESQRHAIRTLRSTSRLLDRPFRRSFWSLEDITRDQTMFSVIPEECCDSDSQCSSDSECVPDEVKLEDDILDEKMDVPPAATSHCTEDQDSWHRYPRDQQTLTDPKARLVLAEHYKHQHQNTRLEQCMEVLRHVHVQKGVDEDDENDALYQGEDVEEGEESTLATSCVTLDWMEDKEDSNNSTASHQDDDSEQSATTSSSSVCSEESSGSTATKEQFKSKSSGNVHGTDRYGRFADLIKSKRQEHGCHTTAHLPGSQALQSISSASLTVDIPPQQHSNTSVFPSTNSRAMASTPADTGIDKSIAPVQSSSSVCNNNDDDDDKFDRLRMTLKQYQHLHCHSSNKPSGPLAQKRKHRSVEIQRLALNSVEC